MASRDVVQSAAAAVFCDTWLLRQVTSYQTGVPLALYTFWIQHDAETPPSSVSALKACHLDTLLSLVVTKGIENHLELFVRVQYFDSHGVLHANHVTWRTALVAIEKDNALALEWVLARVPLEDQSAKKLRWWFHAFTHYQPNQLDVLDFLKAQYPIEASDLVIEVDESEDAESSSDDSDFSDEREPDPSCMDKILECKHVGLIEWVHETWPTVLESRAARLTSSAAWRGDLATIQYVYEHISPSGVSLRSFQAAYRGQHFDVFDYLVERHAELLQGSESAVKFQKEMVQSTNPNVQAYVKKHATVFRLGLPYIVEEAVRRRKLEQIY